MLFERNSLWLNPRFKVVASVAIFLLALYLVFEEKGVRGLQKPLPSSPLPVIPNNIWHIFLRKREISPNLQPAIHSWAELNPHHEYHLIETVQATDILFDLYKPVRI